MSLREEQDVRTVTELKNGALNGERERVLSVGFGEM